jgi:outer membrane receptor protein involved in Fe transport
MKRNGKTRLWLAMSVPFACASVATAQERADEIEMIVVTGSRLAQRHLMDAAPVTVLSRNDIDATGAASVGELLRELPAAGASTSESAGRGNNGSATVALRGLSAVNTLVLINGRRVLANNADGTIDLNSIPFDAIERVEVLQDGASAVYGSDAIAGVVNIIMRTDFDGLLLRAGYGESSRGDLPNRELGLTFGRDFEGGQFVFNASWNDAGGNVIADRPVSRDPDWRAQGGRNFRDPLPPYAVVTGLDPNDPDRTLILREGVDQATSIDDFRDFIFPGTDTPLSSGNDGINYWEYESSAVDIEKLNLWFSGSYDINEDLAAFVEASYNNRQSYGFLAPNYFGSVFGEPVTLSANNDFNPFGVDLDIARTIIEQLDYPDTQARISDVDASTHRIVAGLQGELAGWGWDVSYNHQQLHQFTYGGYNRVMEWIRQAAGDSDACRAATNGCVPINLLGAPGSITREMLDFISEDTFTDIHAKLDSIVANATGKVFELPNGDVNLALGAEYRVEEFDQNSANRNQFIELGTTSDAHPPQRKVSEFYVETSLPLFADLPFMNSLDLDLAARYSHYNDFGNTTNPKVGLKWQVSDAVLLRASWGTGFRAPAFTEAYGAQTRGFQPVNDPCLGPNFAAYPGCNGQQATTTSSGAFVLRGGNPDLEPEEADNLTMGVVWRPEFFAGLALTLDYYEIEKTGIIGTANIDYVIEQNALNGSFADRVTRDAGNAVFEVILTRDNLLQQEIKGYDLGVEYATEQTAFGVFSGRLDLTYLDSHKQSPAPDLPAVERIGTYSVEVGTLAKYRWNGRLNWTLDNVDLSTGIRYVDDITNEGSLLVNGERLQTDDYLQADLLVDYLFDDSGITISLGVENIFDEMPPWLEGNYFNGFDEGSFHSRGRFFYTRIEKLF